MVDKEPGDEVVTLPKPDTQDEHEHFKNDTLGINQDTTEENNTFGLSPVMGVSGKAATHGIISNLAVVKNETTLSLSGDKSESLIMRGGGLGTTADQSLSMGQDDSNIRTEVLE